MFFDDFLCDGQAQAGAAVAFGGVEELEHVLHHGARDARAVVNDFDNGLFVVLLVAWLLGLSVFHVAGGLIHILLIFAVISLILHFVRGRRGVA